MNDSEPQVPPSEESRHSPVSVKKTPRPRVLLWLDLETTGLDPQRDRIIEYAAVITDLQGLPRTLVRDGLGGPVTFLEGLVSPGFDDKEIEVPLEVAVMHGGPGGLLAASVREGAPLANVEERLVELLEAARREAAVLLFGMDEPVGLEPLFCLAGNSVHFDRSFLASSMPRVLEQLHYQHVDVTSLLIAEQAVGLPWPPRVGTIHRARADLERSIEAYRRHLGMVQVPS